MSPELLTISARRDTALRACMHANGLFAALLAAAFVVARVNIASLFHLPSPLISLLCAFALAFAAAYVFRVAVKEPLPRTFALVAALANLLMAALLLALLILQHYSSTANTILAIVAALYAAFGAFQILLLLRASHAYHQTPIVVV